MITRSLNVPGSDSSALTARITGCSGSFGRNDHLSPVGKPAPPRPRRSESLTSCSSSAGWYLPPLSTALAVAYPKRDS